MSLLILASLLWLAVHIGIAGTAMRDRLASSRGEQRFRGEFAVAAAAALAFLLYSYGGAERTPLWSVPGWFVVVVDLAMLAAFVMLANGAMPQPGADRPNAEPRGIFRVTRHPLMSAVLLWSGAHLLANGDTASIVFFGTFALTVLFGLPSIDAKLERRDPARAATLFRSTSRVPFGAILEGRNHLELAEIGWFPTLAALVAWVVVLHFHTSAFGVSALPVW